MRSPALRTFMLSCLCLAAFAAEPPQKLAPVVVKADVPIVKIGEFTMTKGRFGAAVVTDDVYLYVIGGATSFSEIHADVERIDLRTLRSEPFATLKFPRFFHRAVVHGRKIYVLGGRYFAPSATPPLETEFFERIPTPGNTAYPPLSRGSTPPSATFVGAVEVIDLDRRTVAKAESMPVSKAHFAAAIYHGKLYVIGGQKLKGSFTANTNSVEILDFATGRWSEGVPMPTGRQTQAAVVDDFIVVPGGYTGEQALATVEFFSPKEGAWKKLPDLGDSRSAFSMAVLGKHLFLFGDYDYTDEILTYNLATRTSDTFTLNYRRARHSDAVARDGLIYVVGGRIGQGFLPLDTIQVFALRTDPRAAAAATGKR